MRTNFLFLLLLLPIIFFSQPEKDSLRYPVFAATPFHENVKQVNGMAMGFGTQWTNPHHVQKINGFNLELNPVSILHMLEPTDSISRQEVMLIHNGLYISSAGYNQQTIFNGMAISVYNLTKESNGLGIAVLTTASEELNGVYISGAVNYTDNGKGVLVGVINWAKKYKGVQVGLINNADELKGIQLGFYNKNSKRALPFINWDFKKQ